MVFFKSIIFFTALFYLTLAGAVCGPRSCTDKVEMIGANRNVAFHWVRLKNTQQSAVTGCVFDSGYYAKLPSTGQGSKEIFAVILTAQALGRDVALDYLQGSNPCEIVSANLIN